MVRKSVIDAWKKDSENESKKVQLTVRITEETARRIQDVSKRLSLSRNRIVQDLLDDAVSNLIEQIEKVLDESPREAKSAPSNGSQKPPMRKFENGPEQPVADPFADLDKGMY